MLQTCKLLCNWIDWFLEGVQGPENLFAALKTEAGQVGAEAGSQLHCSELPGQQPSSGGSSLMNTQTGINDLLKVFTLWTFQQTTFLWRGSNLMHQNILFIQALSYIFIFLHSSLAFAFVQKDVC